MAMSSVRKAFVRAAGGPISSFAEKRGSFFSGPDGGGKWLKGPTSSFAGRRGFSGPDGGEGKPKSWTKKVQWSFWAWPKRWQNVGISVCSLVVGAYAANIYASKLLKADVDRHLKVHLAPEMEKDKKFREAASKKNLDFQGKTNAMYDDHQIQKMDLQRDLEDCKRTLSWLNRKVSPSKGSEVATAEETNAVRVEGNEIPEVAPAEEVSEVTKSEADEADAVEVEGSNEIQEAAASAVESS